ncbi:MAG: hypothetical protein MUE98_16400 [Rhodobacteraceae bacterium]|nr:hypothetical protein [Paracoccaceae bacterium]
MTSALIASGLFGQQFGDAGVAAEFSVEAFGARMLAFEAAWTRALARTGAVSAGDAGRPPRSTPARPART